MGLKQLSSKSIRYIATLPITLLIVLFATSNRREVAVELWPFDLSLAFPLYAVVLVSVVAGLVFGVAVAWLSGASTRQRARSAERKIKALEKKLATYPFP